MFIICTTEALGGETACVDREMDIWFESDYNVYGQYALMIFPKTCWKRIEELTLPTQ